MAINKIDLEFIELQLGRKPRGVLEISARCKSGHPLVVKTRPIIDNQFFPTLYYLVCAEMIKKVFKLEGEGLTKALQQRIDDDEVFKKRFLEAQKDYVRERNKIVADQFSELCRAGSPNTPFPQVGIGGVRKLDKIKCLHAQLAHLLATGKNPVGEEVAKIVGLTCK